MIEAIPAPKSIRGNASRAALFVYKQVLSPLLHAVSGSAGACRFQPTCSEYAIVAIETHGGFRGTWLALLRLAKCHPFHPPAFDPVPMQTSQPPFTIEEQVPRGPAASPPLSQPPHERR